jgi:archaellum component FlaF (FlaF/FlaG flagellin family)
LGFSVVTTHVILFIAAIGIATGLLFGIKNFSDTAESSINMKADDYNNKIKTSIQVEMISFDEDRNITNVYVRNTGRTMLDPLKMDVYLDGVRIPRNSTNRTIEVTDDTDLINEGIFDPKETIHIAIFGYVDDLRTHDVTVTTPYEVKDSETFSR